MPWPTADRDLKTAFERFPDDVIITHSQWEVRVDLSPDSSVEMETIRRCLLKMLRAVSKYGKYCEYGECQFWIYMMPGDRKEIPVRVVKEDCGIVIRNHFRDCAGLASQATTRPAATPQTDNHMGAKIAQQKPQKPKPTQASLFDLGAYREYAD